MWKTKCQETTEETFYCELIFSFTLTGSPAANLELFRRLSRTKHHAKFLQSSCLRFPCGHNYNLLFGSLHPISCPLWGIPPSTHFSWEDWSEPGTGAGTRCLVERPQKQNWLPLEKTDGEIQSVSEWSLPFHSKHFLPIPLVWMKGK